MRTTRPDVVVHTVALTDVDACERDPGAAYAVSVLTTLHLADALAALPGDPMLVYISSDQVYSGRGPHRESEASPLNAYGAVKHAGELAAACVRRHLVVRTNFVGHSRGGRPSYTDWLEGAAREGRTIRVHPDAAFSALALPDLVELLAEMIERELVGTFNLGSRGGMRKLDFARAVAGAVAADGDSLVVEDRTDDPSRAPRALDLVLDVGRAEAALERALPSMADCVAHVVAELIPARTADGS